MNKLVTKAMSVVPASVSNKVGKATFKMKKHAPEIAFTTGMILIGVGVVKACKATRKVDDILAAHEANVDAIVKAKETCPEDQYSAKDAVEDTVKTYTETIMKLGKAYRKAGIYIVGGAALTTGAFVGVVKQRENAIAAAASIASAFSTYRDRTRAMVGEEKEKDIYLGKKVQRLDVKETDEKGETKVVNQKTAIIEGNEYGVWFDEASPCWKKDPLYNKMFLESQQNYANQLLRANGHLFLNEVYDMIGVPRTSAGAVVGWLANGDDGFVDFGLYEGIKSAMVAEDGSYERSIYLDFNVDGVIYDKI